MTKLPDRHFSAIDDLSAVVARPVMPEDDALLSLGSWLGRKGYHFVTPTPGTHARINARPQVGEAKTLHDVFGWSRPFRPALLPRAVLRWLEQADSLESTSGLLRSKVRFSSLDDSLYMHSAYPTVDPDAVFFGPDTYRFATLIRQTLATYGDFRPDCVVDIGCGSGAGGIVAVQALLHPPSQLIMADINPVALRYARVNATMAGVPDISLREGDLFEVIDKQIDLLVANPPYLLDPQARIYRHGGGELGSALSTRIVEQGLSRLAAGGMLILYTGTPIINGKDTFLDSIAGTLANPNIRYAYAELDPDVFGEQLEDPAYAQVDRIAVVALVIRVSPHVTATAPKVVSMSRRIPEIMLNKPYWRSSR